MKYVKCTLLVILLVPMGIALQLVKIVRFVFGVAESVTEFVEVSIMKAGTRLAKMGDRISEGK